MERTFTPMGVASTRSTRAMPGASTDSTCPGSVVPASDAFSPATGFPARESSCPSPRYAGHAGQTPFRNARFQRMHGVDGVGLQRDGPFVEKMLGRDGLRTRTFAVPAKTARCGWLGSASTLATDPWAMTRPPSAPERGRSR